MCKKIICLVCFVFMPALASSTAVADMVAYYPLDEGTGVTTADASGKGHNGTLRNGVTWILPGYVGNSAINVDGNPGSRVAIGTWDPSEGTGQLSLALWVRWSGEQDKSDHQGLIGKRDSWGATGALRWFLEVRNDGRIHMRNYSQAVAAPAGTLNPFINQWAHVAVTFDGTTVRIYLNGEERASGEFSLHDKTDAAMGIGCTHGGSDTNSEVFSGDLDEVYIYDNALSQAEIQELATGITPTFPKARRPQPEDGATYGDNWAYLIWKPGDSAASHDVYFGDNFDDVNDGTGGTFQGNQTDDFFLVGIQGYPYPDGLVSNKTYYWRIDEVEDDGITIYKGDVWSFFVPPKKAYKPNPPDGASFVDKDVTLSFAAGFGAKIHYIYFGDNFADVDAGTESTNKGTSPTTSFAPGPLELGKTYYWRIDENDGFNTYKGDVWSFTTTISGLGTIVCEIWENISGDSIDNLRNDPRYPALPDSNELLTELSWDGPDIDNYGGRIYGWLYVPATGDYTFWLTTDNDGELWLSRDDDPENVELIANISGWAGANEWNKFASQKSDPVSLTSGNKYYILALWKEGSGGDHCRAAWQGPGISTRTIIPGIYLSPYEPVKAYGPDPWDGATGIERTPTLKWKPGNYASSHKVYFSDNFADVSDGTALKGSQTETSYGPVGPLELEKTYYWRIDEVNNLHPDSPWIGEVWSFTVAGFLIVDDFEDYDAGENQIWYAWRDGLGFGAIGTPPYSPGNGTGSAVGDENTPSYTEETIVNTGEQSMPYWYDNNKPDKAKYSEAKLTLSDTRNWTEEGVKALSLWFRGYSASVGSFIESPAGTYTMTASGYDIWRTGAGVETDEFHYAYKTLVGPGTIIAKVESVQNTNDWAKAGVMIRETLDPNSAHAFACMTPASGVASQGRPSAGGTSFNTNQTGIATPHWVRLERDMAGNFTVSHSANGTTWEPVQNAVAQNIPMSASVFIGLAVTAHDAALTCEAVFSNVTITGNVSAQWMHQDIGILSNDPEQIYVAVANRTGTPAVVYHDNPNAAQIATWTEWNIDLKDFADKGVALADVNSIAIGFGDRNNPQAGGSGKMYFDDIRLYRPRYIPGMGTPLAGDLNSDGVVDFRDLEIMAGDWLEEDYFLTTADPTTANLVAYYSLNEGAGTVAGDSAGTNNGAVMGGAQWVPGPDGLGSALHFDGTSQGQYVDLGLFNPSSGELTVALWAKWDGLSSFYQGLIGKRDTWNSADMMWQIEANRDNGTLGFFREGSYPDDGNPVLPVGEWAHVAASFDGTDAVFYVNGRETGRGGFSFGEKTDAALVLGACQSNGGNPFNGALDEIRIYNRALSETEIAYLVSNGAASLHVPVLSSADLYDDEPQGSKALNFRDYAVLADQWLDKQLWPEW